MGVVSDDSHDQLQPELLLALGSADHRFANHQRLPGSSLGQALNRIRPTAVSSRMYAVVLVQFKVFGHGANRLASHP